MEIGRILLLVLATDVGVHRAALDGTGADDGDLDDEVVERLGLETWQRRHLGPTLHLEDAHRVGLAKHLVDLVALLDRGDVDHDAVVVAHEVDGVVQRRQHPQAEQVELHEPCRRAVVLVPLEHGAVLHPPPLHRAHLDHRPVAHDHAARVDAEVAREVLHLAGERQHLFGHELGGRLLVLGCSPALGVGPRSEVGVVVELLRPGIDLSLGEAEHLAHVAHGRAGPVGDDVGDLGGVLAAVLLVDVLDRLFPTIGLDVDVDVGWPVALVAAEPRP